MGYYMNKAIIYPKNAPKSLINKTEKALRMLKSKAVSFRKSSRYGYKTLALGHCERLVKVGECFHVFNQHSDYEKFINTVR